MSARSPSAPEGEDKRQGRVPHTFLCREDLYRAFEARARDLGCSVDWLLGEAMKRLLADAGRKRPLPPPAPPPAPRRIALRLGETRVVVDRDRFVIGRSAREAHFAVRDGGVSRQHAIIERALDGTWIVIDMASTNGILLNRARVTRAPIKPGDVLEVGPFAIAVERA